MRFYQSDKFRRYRLVRLFGLATFGLVSCAWADSEEQYVPYPGLQNDYISGLPTTGESNGYTYEVINGIAVEEGDIILGEVDSEGRLITPLSARGVGKNTTFSRWPDGIVIYEAPVGNSQIQQERVAEAIAHWMENTTLTFVERTPENADQYPSYIQFIDSLNCASHVGMIGGPQPVYTSDNCTVGSVIHEIGHVVGLFHEHTRADRDNFITIDWDEIEDDREINFDLQTANTDAYSEYDYSSIMHYGAFFFSKSRPRQPTIIVADGIEIGQREALSPLDIQSVNLMYETDLAIGPLASSFNENELEIDITIYNQGLLGAHQLQLLMQLDDNTEWISVSGNSGWNCVTLDAELACTRDTMQEQSESRFTVVANTASTSTNDLSIGLFSRTQDSNPENNTLNDDNVEWLSLDTGPEIPSSVEILVAQEVTEAPSDDDDPVLQAATQSEAGRQTTPVVADVVAGFAGTSLLALLASIMGIRSRHRQRKIQASIAAGKIW